MPVTAREERSCIAPGEDPGSDLSAEAVITHEYGHHIAANRSNAPWLALDWGPKRWASAMQVCAKARQGVLVPGAEDPVQYTENPGEGWAESVPRAQRAQGRPRRNAVADRRSGAVSDGGGAHRSRAGRDDSVGRPGRRRRRRPP